MKVCVIGGLGYIGSHAVYELIRDKNEVVVIDNLSTGDKSFKRKEVKYYKGDITKEKEMDKIFKKECEEKPFDVVMHFAAKLIVPESLDMPLEYYHNNVEGVRIMLKTMVNYNIKNIIFSSTAAVYGNVTDEVCTEETPTNPESPYGDSKLACEKLIKWVCMRYKMNYCIFRYFNVAGADYTLEIGLKKDNLTHLIPIVVQTALGIREKVIVYGDDFDTRDGSCIRDYIHVSDLAYAHVLGAKYMLKNNKSLLCNLGSNKGYTVKEVIREVEKILPVNYEIGPRRQGDPAKVLASNKKAKEILGWTPKYELSDMIKSDMEFRRKFL